MKFLLDTHVLIWFCEGSQNIPKKTTKILQDIANAPLGISAISPWEIAKKASIGKIKFSIPVADWLSRAVINPGIEIVNLSPGISYEANYLPGHFHKDPADQIIVATARVHELALITCDRRIIEYEHVRTFWE